MASSTVVGGHRDRRYGLSYCVVTDQLLVLRPATAAPAEHPGRANTAIVVRSADHDDTAIGRQRDRRCGLSYSPGANQLLVQPPLTAVAGKHQPAAPGPILHKPAHNGDVAVSGERDGRALAGTSAAYQLLAFLRPTTAISGEYPCRPGGAKPEGHRWIPHIVARPTQNSSVAVGRESNGPPLVCASHSTGADELLALLRPCTATPAEHPGRTGFAVVGPPTHEGGVAVGGQRDGHSPMRASHSAVTYELAFLRPRAAAIPRKNPCGLGPPPTYEGGVAVGGERDRHSLAPRGLRFTLPIRVGTDELVALLCPSTAGAGEHPSCSHRLAVAGSAHNGTIAVGGHGDGRTLGP